MAYSSRDVIFHYAQVYHRYGTDFRPESVTHWVETRYYVPRSPRKLYLPDWKTDGGVKKRDRKFTVKWIVHEEKFVSQFFKTVKVGYLIQKSFSTPMLGFSFCFQVASELLGRNMPRGNSIRTTNHIRRELDRINSWSTNNQSYAENIYSLTRFINYIKRIKHVEKIVRSLVARTAGRVKS